MKQCLIFLSGFFIPMLTNAQNFTVAKGNTLTYRIQYSQTQPEDTATKNLSVTLFLKEFGLEKKLLWTNSETSEKGEIKVSADRWKHANSFIMDNLFEINPANSKKLSKSSGIWLSQKEFTAIKKNHKYVFKIEQANKGELQEIVYQVGAAKFSLLYNGTVKEVDAITLQANQVAGLYNIRIAIANNRNNPVVLSSVIDLIKNNSIKNISGMYLQEIR